MSEACLKQIRYWFRTVKQYQKAIKRKNKYINRLERENSEMNAVVVHLRMRIAELELEKPVDTSDQQE